MSLWQQHTTTSTQLLNTSACYTTTVQYHWQLYDTLDAELYNCSKPWLYNTATLKHCTTLQLNHTRWTSGLLHLEFLQNPGEYHQLEILMNAKGMVGTISSMSSWTDLTQKCRSGIHMDHWIIWMENCRPRRQSSQCEKMCLIITATTEFSCMLAASCSYYKIADL